FLPAFDEYVIAYKDRTNILAVEHHPKAFSKNGIFQPVIIRNGSIVGVWKKAANKNRIEIQPSFFEAINLSSDRIKIATDRYGAFFSSGISHPNERQNEP
ncbi:MAG: winged helix DNA-binding domain-containing protein, partial [Dysgonamonadaceae bacterium]|nr:winged helix DNA-binding domain-containing protein [Dysgonamonadaceae bacterium]